MKQKGSGSGGLYCGKLEQSRNRYIVRSSKFQLDLRSSGNVAPTKGFLMDLPCHLLSGTPRLVFSLSGPGRGKKMAECLPLLGRQPFRGAPDQLSARKLPIFPAALVTTTPSRLSCVLFTLADDRACAPVSGVWSRLF